MQKFTKFALALVMGLGAAASYADSKTLYSWESPEGTPIEQGGVISYVNGGANNRLNYQQAGYWTICLNGKKANLNDETASDNAGHMEIAFEEALKAGDVITLTCFYNKGEEKAVSAWFVFETGATVASARCTSDLKVEGSAPMDIDVVVPAEAEGSMSLKMTRNDTGTNLFINKMVINGERDAAAAGWDGTVATSLDAATVTSLADFDGLTLTFPGAASVEVLGEDDCAYLALQNQNGSELYGIWSPAYGSTYTIDGNMIELGGFMAVEGVTAAIPAGTTKLFVEDYGTLKVDGAEIYVPTLEFNANIVATTAEPFMFTSVVNYGVEGNVVGVEASENGVSYQFNVFATGKALSAGTALPTLQIVEKADVDFGAASIMAYGGDEAYIRFMAPEKYFFTEAGTYLLTIPEGTFVDAEGTPNAAAYLKWVVIESDEPTIINIESAEVGTVADNSWGTNDVYYTVALNFTKPEGAKYAFSEGLFVSLNGESSTAPFELGNHGFIDLSEAPAGSLIFKDMLMAATDDAAFEGELRAAGSYVATGEIYFMDSDYVELPTIAKYTGSIVLPELAKVEVGTPVFSIDEDPFYGKIELSELEANGLKLTFPEAEGITPDMTIKAVASLYVLLDNSGAQPLADGDDDDYTNGTSIIPVMENCEFVGDAMFGAPVVNFAEFVQFIAEYGRGAYAIEVKSVDVLAASGVVASWTPEVEDGDTLTLITAFEVTERYVIESVTAEVCQTKPNEWGDQHYVVTLTVPAAELEGLDIVKAYTEGVMFDSWTVVEGDTVSNNFTFMADALEGVAVEAGKDVEIACTDAFVGQTTDTTYEGEIRAEGTYPAHAMIVLVNAFEQEVAYAEYRGEITLSKDVVTGLNKVQFNVNEVIFNLNGQRVNNANGIVIKNGVKMIIK